MTTMMPAPTPARVDRKVLFVLIALVMLVVISQAQNLFQFPYIQDVEGTNLSNGWALLNQGQLSPYTYAYEEPPAGSILIGLWGALTRTFAAVELSPESGRVLMLICHALTVTLLFGIAYKLTHGMVAPILVVLIFAFSPLTGSLQRRVILDNIMLVWLLLSFYLIVGDYRKLTRYMLSAVCFGLAVLVRESAIFMLPAFLYVIRLQANKHHWRFATTLWIILTFFLIAFYPLYAQMKEELFPMGWWLGGNFPHVSLLEAIADRGPATGTFLNIGSGLADSFRSWVDVQTMIADPILIYGGLVSLPFVLVMALDNRRLRSVVALTLGAAFFLIAGGRIVVSDVLMIAPFLALLISILLAAAVGQVARIFPQPLLRFLVGIVALVILMYPFIVYYSSRLERFTLDQVAGQREAIAWLQNNVARDSVIVTDNYAFLQLRQKFPGAHHYWRVDTDPAVKYLQLNDDVCTIDYVLATPQIAADIQTFNLDLMRRVMEQSRPLMSFDNNGWNIEIRQVSKSGCKLVSGERSS
ncbi:MAG: glycosyltransferase family 39 protein [Chloroflexi bacterium]|nr:glycosyltransferase family 39 protein [Chloroflexota bacterium]